jgi:PAS domain S-box-containing protein
MKCYWIIWLVLFAIFLTRLEVRVFAQSEEIDRLQKLLKTASKDQQRVDLLNQLAHEHFDVDDSLAMVYALQALKDSRKNRYPLGEKYAHSLVGFGLYSTGNYSRAIIHFQQSDQIIVSGSQSVATHNQLLQGMAYGELGDYNVALSHFNKARKIADSHAPEFLPSIYINSAWLCLKQWRNEQALSYLDSASTLVIKGDDYMQSEQSSMYTQAFLNLLQLEKAKAALDQLCLRANRANSYYHKIECQIKQSRLQLIKGEYNAAMTSSLEAIALSKKYNYYQYVEVLHQTADAYLEISQLELTAQYLYKALQLSEAAGLKHQTGKIYNSLAWLTKIQRKYETAIDYTNKAQLLLEQVGDPHGVAESYNVRGLTYSLMGDYSNAEKQYKKSLQIRREINHATGVAGSLYNLADIYLELNRNQEALTLLNEVVVIEEKIGNKPNLSMTYGQIARQLIRERRFGEALTFLKKAEQIGKEDHSLYIKRDNARSYSFYYLEQSDYKNAHRYQREYEYINDEIYSSKGADKLAEYEALYKTQKRDHEIELLNQKQQRQEDQLKFQKVEIEKKNLMILSACIGLMVIVVAGLINYTSYKQKIKVNEELRKLNQEVLSKNKEVQSNLDHIVELKNDLGIKEQQYRSLIENATDLIYEVDENGKFIYFNPVSERITGYTAEELLRTHFWEIIHPEFTQYYTEKVIDLMKKQTDTCYLEVLILTKDGKKIWIGQNIKMIYHNNYLIKGEVIGRDISKQKFAEEEELKAKEHAEKASAVKSEFLANVSHEIRTPLNAIIGFSDLLIRTGLNAAQKKYVSTILKSADSLLTMIDDVLDFSKIEAGKMELSITKFNLKELGSQVTDMLSQQATEKGLHLSFVTSPQTPSFIYLDETRLRQVLVNLIANAIKFTSQGEVELKIDMLGSVLLGACRLKFSVKDTGIGIDPKNQQKVFEAFVQEDISNTKKYGGTGLGLAISNKLLALMGSCLELESEKGKGSLFHFTIECPVVV